MALKSCAESCVHPSRASICSKILKFVEIGATAGSGTNYESSYARLAIEKFSKGWHIDQNIVISTSSWLKKLRTGFIDT